MSNDNPEGWTLMTNFHLPSNTSYVSASWQSHKNRNPPSSEPGTDYASSYGAPLYAPDNGVITYVKHDNGGGGGRTVRLKPDDGQETQSLHNSEIWVSPGQRVKRGQQIGRTGASGFGDDWYYGPHVHQTLWQDVAWVGPTIDFALYVGSAPAPTPTPTPTTEDEEDPMAFHGAYYKRASDGATVYMLFNENSGFYSEYIGGGGSYNNPIAQHWGTGSYVSITESHASAIKRDLNAVQPQESVVVEIDEADVFAAVAAYNDEV